MTDLEVRRPAAVVRPASAVRVRSGVRAAGGRWAGLPGWARFVASAALFGLLLAPGWRPWSGEWFVWSELTWSAWHRPGTGGVLARLVVAPLGALAVAVLVWMGVGSWRRR